MRSNQRWPGTTKPPVREGWLGWRSRSRPQGAGPASVTVALAETGTVNRSSIVMDSQFDFQSSSMMRPPPMTPIRDYIGNTKNHTACRDEIRKSDGDVRTAAVGIVRL